MVETDGPALKLAAGVRTDKGAKVVVIGNPSGLAGVQLINAVTTGTLDELATINKETFHQLMVEVMPGNSGGPVLDEATGAVIGVLTAGVFVKAPDGEGVRLKSLGRAYSIPVKSVAQALDRLGPPDRWEEASREAAGRHAAVLAFVHVHFAEQACAAALNARIAMVDNPGYSYQWRTRTYSSDRAIADLVKQLHKQLFDRVQPTITALRRDPSLPTAVRKPLQDMIDNYHAIKELNDRPPTTARRVQATLNDRVKKHEGYYQQLKRELELPEHMAIRIHLD
jgi:hypothetical protein